jgi:hypothetical protein
MDTAGLVIHNLWSTRSCFSILRYFQASNTFLCVDTCGQRWPGWNPLRDSVWLFTEALEWGHLSHFQHLCSEPFIRFRVSENRHSANMASATTPVVPEQSARTTHLPMLDISKPPVIEGFTPLSRPREETFQEKFMRKSKENPFVPIGQLHKRYCKSIENGPAVSIRLQYILLLN